MAGREAVKVVVRCRPMNSKEKEDGRKPTVAVDPSVGSVEIRNPKAPEEEPKRFTFDSVFDDMSTQKEVYEDTGVPLVESVLAGYNGTMFAYGQTGCGKTHTMQGKSDRPELRGVIPNSFEHIFDHIRITKDREFLVRASYMEIYNEEIRDLLGDDHLAKLELKEDPDKGVFAKGLQSIVVDSVEAIDALMTKGNSVRTVGSTAMNAESSRSHSIFTIVIEMSGKREDGSEHVTAGKLNLVDLAGSERQSKTQATGARLKEGIKINLSLTALGNVISALVEGKSKHIPYRDSKLTRLLQDSLGGNTKTVMMAAIGPADYNYDETLSTLRYANRAKNIKNKPVINEDPKDAMLREYKEEIERLKAMLSQQGGGAIVPAAFVKQVPSEAGMSDEAIREAEEARKRAEAAESLTAVAEAKAAAAAEAAAKNEEEKQRIAAELAAKQEAIDAERKMREELAAKLAALENSLMGAGHAVHRKKIRVKKAHGTEGVAATEGAAQESKTVSSGEASAAAEAAAPEGEEDEYEEQEEGEAEAVERAAREEEEARKREEVRRARHKARLAKRREAKAKEEAARAEAEREAAEEERKAMADANAAAGDLIRKLKEKHEKEVKKLKREVRDAEWELNTVRETMMAQIREQDREQKLLEQLVAIFFTPKELNQIFERAEWNEEQGCWGLPAGAYKPGAGLGHGRRAVRGDVEEGGAFPSVRHGSAATSAGRRGASSSPLSEGGGELPGIGNPSRGRSSRSAQRAHPDWDATGIDDVGGLPGLAPPSSTRSQMSQPRASSGDSEPEQLPSVGGGAKRDRSRASSRSSRGRGTPDAFPSISATRDDMQAQYTLEQNAAIAPSFFQGASSFEDGFELPPGKKPSSSSKKEKRGKKDRSVVPAEEDALPTLGPLKGASHSLAPPPRGVGGGGFELPSGGGLPAVGGSSKKRANDASSHWDSGGLPSIGGGVSKNLMPRAPQEAMPDIVKKPPRHRSLNPSPTAASSMDFSLPAL
jgi:hypothetical protein